MKENLTQLIFILDKSGSMSGLEKDTIGGFNSLIEKQKKESGDAIVTTVLFDTNMETVHDRVPLQEVKPMTLQDYCPSGCTALLDAVGSTITETDAYLKELKEEEKPARTLVVIVTDGMENSSKEYRYENCRKMINEHKAQGWEFIFLGANIDVVEEASRFGISQENAVSYNCDGAGIEINYQALDECVSQVRKGKILSSSWRKQIDDDVRKRG